MAIKRINSLDINGSPMPDDYLVIDNGTSTERVLLRDLKEFFSVTSTPTHTPTPSTTMTLSATPTPTTTNTLTPTPTPSAIAAQYDRVFYSGSVFTIKKSWENTITAVDAKHSLTTDGLYNVNSGVIPYHQGTNSDRRSYISNDGHSGSRSLKFVLSPSPPDGTGEAIQVWNSGYGLGVGSGSTYNCVEGSEIWARAWVKLSANWSWDPVAYDQSISTLKMLRIYPFNTYQGELIVQVDSGHGYSGYAGRLCAFTQGFTGGNISLYGGPGGDCAGNPGTAADMPLDTWFSIEAYMKISATPATAKVIIWRDGVKILEKTGGSTYQTLNRTGTNELIASPGFILFSTWDVNGNQDGPNLPNGEQSIKYDDIIVSTDRAWVEAHGSQDASGNWMIGTAS